VSSTPPNMLYYYCSAETALTNLSDHSLEWITPARFDGITELNHDSRIDYSKEELTRAFVKIASSLVFASDDPKGNSPLISAINRWREAERFDTHEEAEAVLNDLCGKIVDQHLESLSLLSKRWHTACQHLHFVQMFSKYDNFNVWRDYGDNFRGAVLAFSIDEESQFHTAQAIRYLEYAPELSNLKEQVACMLHGAQVRPEKKIIEKFTIKAPDLKQQKEWRCFQQDDEQSEEQTDPDTWSKRINFQAAELKGIYLGPLSPANIKEEILSLEGISDINAYQLKFASGKYELQSKKIES